MRWSLVSLLAFAVAASADDISYVRQPTREATWEKSLAATRQALTRFKLLPWRTLSAENAVIDSSGGTDFAKTYDSPGGKIGWVERKAFDEAEWTEVPEGVRWMARDIIASQEQEVIFRLAARRPMTIRLNNAPLPGVGPAGWLSDQLANINEIVSFPAKLKAGTNHVWVRFADKGHFFFEVTPVTDSIASALEARIDQDFPPTGERRCYRLETIPLPPHVVLEVGGMDFMPDGRLMVCTRRGEIWAFQNKTWSLFASGLQEPLGLLPGTKGEVYVVQRSELTRISDTDGDGKADRFDTLNSDIGVSTTQHAYIFGPVRDKEGNFYGAISSLGAAGPGKYFGWSFKITPDGKFIPWSSGLRSPNGILMTPEGEIFIADNQGEYVGTSPLHHVTKGAFHGYPLSLKWDPDFKGDPYKVPIEELQKMRKPPAVLFPYGSMGQSISQPVMDLTGGKFGPFTGQIFIGDVTKSVVVRVTLDKVAGEFQGACYPFRSGFQSGNNRLAFAPDGSLYVGQTDRGWGSVGGKSYGLQRLIWTRQIPFEVEKVTQVRGGFQIDFTQALTSATAVNKASYAVSRYYYRYHSAYGSPQTDVTPVDIESLEVLPSQKSVLLKTKDLQEGRIFELHFDGVRNIAGEGLFHPLAFYTLNRLQK